ncbi:MAG: TraB/GumN family protein [Fusobacteriaceae bacterium]|nr:TraB/GumN family protein [Fusobacteriaceae bacterium]
MLKFHLFLFLVIVTIVSGNDSKGFFYKATKNHEVIYLFGDMKYKCGEMNPLNKIMIESFKESEIVIFRWAKTIENSDKIIEDNKYNDDGYFYRELSDELLELLKIRFSELEYKGIIDRMFIVKPWFIYYTFVMEQLLDVYKDDLLFTSDYFTQNLENKEVVGVTTFANEIEKLSKMNQEELKMELGISLAEFKNISKMEVVAWEKGDEELYKRINLNQTEFIKNLINGNNNIYIEIINKELNRNSKIFVICDLENLLLNNSIIKQLEKEGFKLEKLD